MPSELETVDDHAGALVEDAHDDTLAVDQRQRHHADVHAPSVDGQREATVLGHALLGDVEVGHDLDARDDAHRHAALDGGGRRQHAVDAEQHLGVALLGVDVDVGGALLDRLGDDRVHELDDGRVAVGLVDRYALALLFGFLVDDVLDRVVHAPEPGEQQVEILDGRRRGLDPPTGHHPDVVDRQHVGGIGHRQQQRAVVGEADGQRLVALGGADADEVDGAHVEVVDGQIDEVQAEALGDDAGELVVAQDPLLDQHHAGGPALVAGGRDARLDGLAVGQAEIDDDLADHPLRAPGMARWVQALLLGAGRPRAVLPTLVGVLV